MVAPTKNNETQVTMGTTDEDAMHRILAAMNLQQQDYFTQLSNSQNHQQQQLVSQLQAVAQSAATAATTGAAAAVGTAR